MHTGLGHIPLSDFQGFISHLPRDWSDWSPGSQLQSQRSDSNAAIHGSLSELSSSHTDLLTIIADHIAKTLLLPRNIFSSERDTLLVLLLLITFEYNYIIIISSSIVT